MPYLQINIYLIVQEMKNKKPKFNQKVEEKRFGLQI